MKKRYCFRCNRAERIMYVVHTYILCSKCLVKIVNHYMDSPMAIREKGKGLNDK